MINVSYLSKKRKTNVLQATKPPPKFLQKRRPTVNLPNFSTDINVVLTKPTKISSEEKLEATNNTLPAKSPITLSRCSFNVQGLSQNAALLHLLHRRALCKTVATQPTLRCAPTTDWWNSSEFARRRERVAISLCRPSLLASHLHRPMLLALATTSSATREISRESTASASKEGAKAVHKHLYHQ